MEQRIKNNRLWLPAFAFLLLNAPAVHAQQISVSAAKPKNASFSDVMHDLKLVQQNFQPAPGKPVSCTMTYLYSKELSPTKFLDSLSGSYKAIGNFHYSKLGNTESIQNDSMLLTVYNDDKSIMATPVVQQNKNDRKLFLNTMDSSFVARNAKSVTILTNAGLKTMTFRFTDSSKYYNCILVYNAKTYVPQTISYILRDTKLAESGKPPAEGGVITIRFRGYSTAPLDVSVFNVKKYVSAKPGVQGKLQSAMSGYSFYQNGVIGKSANQIDSVSGK